MTLPTRRASATSGSGFFSAAPPSDDVLLSIKKRIGVGNINRLAFTFSRLSTQQLFVILHQNQWLTMLSSCLHIPLNIDEIIARLNTPSAVFRVLSVGFFAARLAINTTLLLKHTFLPTEGETTLEINVRFAQELQKNHLDLLNDFVWTSLNALTNYAHLFKIPAPVASALVISGLVFDVALLAYRLHQAEQDYEVKKGKCADKELAELNSDMHAKRATFYANIVAASLLTLGYTASLLCALPAALFVSYFVMLVGVALYISDETYGQYQKIRLEKPDPATNDLQKAWNNLVFSMLKNTFGPLIFMGAVALCWEAALIVTALYLVAEGYSYYMTPGSPPPVGGEVAVEGRAAVCAP